MFQRQLAANETDSISTMRSSSSARLDSSNSAVSSIRGSPSQNLSWLCEEESRTSSSAHLDTSATAAASIRGSASQPLSRLTEEESSVSISLDINSPPLPPKGSKLSTSTAAEGDKLNPPEVPRRLSVPNSRHTLARTTPDGDSGRLSAVAAARGLSVASRQSQKQSPVNGTSDLPPKVSKPPPLPRRPILHANRTISVFPEPQGNPTEIAAVSDSSEASRPVSLPQTQLSSVTRQPDAAEAEDRSSPEAEARSVASNAGDSNSTEDSTPRRPVSEMKRNIDARTAPDNTASEVDMRPGVPKRRVVIPAAFRNTTLQ